MSHASAHQPLDLPARHLDIGRVWQATSDAFNQAPRSFMLFGLLPLPAAIAAAMALSLAQGDDTVALASSVVLAGLGLVLMAIGHNATIYGTERIMAGETFRMSDALAEGSTCLPQLIGAWMLSSLLVLAGLLLLVVPGLIAMLAFSLVGGACVLERRGPVAAMRRSVELSRGNLWRIVGAAALVVGVPFAGVVGVGGTLVGVFYAMHTEFSLVVTVGLAAIITSLVAIFFPAISLVVVAALFLELRRLKDGV